MDEPFYLPDSYKGVEQEFSTRLEQRGYIAVLIVDVDGIPVNYERDDEGNWRAIIPPGHPGKPPAVELLRAIAEAIEKILQ